MTKVEIYSTQTCPYCVRAKALFDAKGVAYESIDITGDNEARMALVEKSGGLRTVPQIFINDVHFGGFDNINKLNQDGQLDEILNG